MIFFFSATGNCKNVASIIAERTGEKTVAIADALRGGGSPEDGRFAYDLQAGERVGIVTPTYFWGLPEPTAEFLRRLSLTCGGEPLAEKDVYAYCVSTYGTTPGQTGHYADRLLRESCGISLSARFAVKMVDTWTPMFDLSDAEENSEQTDAAQDAIKRIAEQIENRETGDFSPRPLPPVFAANIVGSFYGPMSDTVRFDVTNVCIGCGLCAKKCPVNAIEMRGKGRTARPQWVKDRCALCLGCLHRCPKDAIRYGKTECSRVRTASHSQFTNPYARV